MRVFILFFGVLSFFLFSGQAQACSNPAGSEGEQIYNTTHKTMQFCNGTHWVSMRGGVPFGSTLGDLGCAAGQIAKWDGSAWGCTADSTGSSAWADLTGVPAGFADGVDNTGITSETDPQVGAVTNGQWCRGSGSAVVCDQSAPGGGGGFRLCTNEQSDGDGSGDIAVCVQATNNLGAGTNNVRFINCRLQGNQFSLSGELARWNGSRWEAERRESWVRCEDGSALIVNW